ncbi:MAG TPA: glycosyltransferase family 2 protein [Tepidisphaeraceae bacterium]|nr:glycosyltransferase family 2 protein [Tepidisphaeraceae bacterium]
MSEPTFTVIVPVYNYEQYVAEAVRSVLAQTYAHWELIIVDDGSTDRSGAIADELAANDPRVTVVHQANGGLAAARNTAIARAQHPWLVMLDADDKLFPDALKHHADAIRRNPDGLVFHGYYHRLEPDGRTIKLTGQFQDRRTGPKEFFERIFLNPSCVCYHKDLVSRHGPFDVRLRTSQDVDFFLRVGREAAYVPVGQPICLRRRHDANLSRQTGHVRTVIAMVLERFLREYGGDAFVTRDRADLRIGRVYYTAGRLFVRDGHISQAKVALRKSLALASTAKARIFLALSYLTQFRDHPNGRTLPDMTPMPEALKWLHEQRRKTAGLPENASR